MVSKTGGGATAVAGHRCDRLRPSHCDAHCSATCRPPPHSPRAPLRKKAGLCQDQPAALPVDPESDGPR